MEETKPKNNFAHLHLHTEYSLLDGLNKIKPLVAKVKELGMTSCAITDHGVMYGIYEFWSECKAAGIKPIIGCEIYLAERTRFDRVPQIDNARYHLTLIAKNQEGYRNLIKMCSLGHVEGFYYKPRVDKELLKKYGKGIIALSGCLSSPINRNLAQGNEPKAQEWLDFIKSCVDELYIEVQRNGVKDSEDLVPKQVALAKKNDLKVVATCDVHYLEKQDWKIQEIAWCIRDGMKLADTNRMRAWSQEFYVKGPEEMYELFKDMPEVVTNSQAIADSVEEYDITFVRVQPKYLKVPKGQTAKELLRELSLIGAKHRYGELTEELQKRLDYELEVIHDKGYDDYFLVVYDYIKWAEDNDIIVGPGRGSGAGSMVAYSLGITKLDPIRWNLLFERFLNPQRPSPPDFDIDFQDNRRDELFEYMEKTYGKKNTSFIGTFGRLKTRAAIRDVARVMGIDLSIADKLSKMVTIKFGKVHTMDMMVEENAEFKELINASTELQELMSYVKKLENVSRHMSTHACGFLVTPTEITDYVPVQRETKGGEKIITQIEGYPLEPMGLMKFDFLGLSNLTIIKNTLNILKKAKNIDIDINDLPLEDKKTFQLFQKGDTVGVFQFESSGMRKYLKDLKPTELEDLIFMNAAYRPGPMQFIPSYIERKYGREEVVYPHEDLKPILGYTYGYAIYQEQVIEIAVKVAGYSLGEADILRRAMGKKKHEVMMAEKEKFVAGCMNKGYTKALGEEIFTYLEPFADYGFNRSHSACYSMIAYQTAYLKANYPVEFMAGLMETDLGNADKITRDVEEAAEMSIKVLPPDINKSMVNFHIEDRNIRFGLAAIKNVGTKIVEHIVEERELSGEFTDLDDLIERVGTDKLSKKSLEFLIMSGALDQFGPRKGLLFIMEPIFERVSRYQDQLSGGQTGLFQSADTVVEKTITRVPDVEVETDAEKVAWEKDLLGTFFSTHPLKQYNSVLIGSGITTIRQIKEKAATTEPETDKYGRATGPKVKVLALITKIKQIYTKNGNKPMGFISLEDTDDRIEAVAFNGVYTSSKDLFIPNTPLIFTGMVSNRNGEVSLLIDEVAPAELKPYKSAGITIDISLVQDQTKLAQLKNILLQNPGESKVTIYYSSKDGTGKRSIVRTVELKGEVIQILNQFAI